MTDWCIIRTAGRHTLGLAESLATDGFEVWTPVETRRMSVPRLNARREVVLPILPSYVFARSAHLVDLLVLAAMPVKPRRGAGLLQPAHSGFRVMRQGDRIPLIADRHLNGLRRIEERRTPIKRAAYSFPRNAAAKVCGGVFGGLVGVVDRSNRKVTVLRFGGGFPVEIPTTMLELRGEMEMAA